MAEQNREFALFIDESGSPKPNPKDDTPYFALGGVLVERVDEVIIDQAVADFKQRWNISMYISRCHRKDKPKDRAYVALKENFLLRYS